MNSSCRKCEKYQISLIQLNYFKNYEAFFFPMFNTKQYPWMKVIHRWRHNRNLKTLITHEIMEILTYFFCKYSLFLKIYPIRAKNQQLFLHDSCPLTLTCKPSLSTGNSKFKTLKFCHHYVYDSQKLRFFSNWNTVKSRK